MTQLTASLHIIENIYLVEYKLSIDRPSFPTWCQEKLRVIATDQFLAMSLVTNWLKETNFIWATDNSEVVEHAIPEGKRDVSIIKAEVYAADIGELLKQCPMPELFPHGE